MCDGLRRPSWYTGDQIDLAEGSQGLYQLLLQGALVGLPIAGVKPGPSGGHMYPNHPFTSLNPEVPPDLVVLPP